MWKADSVDTVDRKGDWDRYLEVFLQIRLFYRKGLRIDGWRMRVRFENEVGRLKVPEAHEGSDHDRWTLYGAVLQCEE